MSTRNNHHSDVTVADVMLPMEKTPKTSSRTMLKEALELMDKHRLGIVCISDSDGTLQGIITDGDIRRMLSNVQKPLAALMSDDVIVHAIKSPTTVTASMYLQDAIDIMGKKQIWDLPVVDQGKLRGLLHLHQAISRILENEK
jgi:arabinose-5-phosphate isomerase